MNSHCGCFLNLWTSWNVHILQMYEKALATNQRLKSRLEISKQELAMIQDQLQRAQVLFLQHEQHLIRIPEWERTKKKNVLVEATGKTFKGLFPIQSSQIFLLSAETVQTFSSADIRKWYCYNSSFLCARSDFLRQKRVGVVLKMLHCGVHVVTTHQCCRKEDQENVAPTCWRQKKRYKLTVVYLKCFSSFVYFYRDYSWRNVILRRKVGV